MRRGLAATLDRAREAIHVGEVLVGGALATNEARLVAPGESLAVTGPRARFVGRGGEKLSSALGAFNLDLTGLRVLDAGSSTGGFTDAALQAGAAAVVAVDVGRGQLHHRLRTDPRVEVHERTNIRHVAAGDLGALAEVIVADLSFTSLRRVVDPLIELGHPGADLVWLVKPQFEADRAEMSGTGGVLTDPKVWQRVLTEVGGTLEGRGATIMGLMTSPLRGADGNVEFLLHATTPGGEAPAHCVAPLAQLIADAIVQAQSP